ncbi:hypothetical protein PAJ_1983 [Pantoea ananatis AJ13355]|uniref:Uncharacterized protein n=1 Tax=Pantoea ananatis (strain AJ13355) TaxID=932677 RepID=A0A0H3KYD0_PANAA|nr:hypothetical protein PAJ_1983 [Pantoea ananatis AJ13355]
MACGTASSTMPSFFACLARRFLPVRISGKAFCTPIKRGRRCVPPDPGSSPNCTSGRPIRVLSSSEQMRALQASASSSPPPRQAPWIAATTGNGNAAIAAITSCPCLASASASWALWQRSIMLISAPAIKLSGLPEISTSPSSCGCLRASAIITAICAANAALSVFIFSLGTSMVITPT